MCVCVRARACVCASPDIQILYDYYCYCCYKQNSAAVGILRLSIIHLVYYT